MEEKILRLFDTWLAKFQYFRDFIFILLTMNRKQADIDAELAEIKAALAKKAEVLDEIKKEHDEILERLENLLSGEESTQMDFTRSTASSIMDRHYNAIIPSEE